MKTLKNSVLGISVLMTLVSCGGSGSSLPSAPPPPAATTLAGPTLDDQIAGFWKLETKGAVDANGIRAPRILKFSVHNGLEQADYCDINRVGANGMSAYEFDGSSLAVHFAEFKNPKHIQAGELPELNKTFGGVMSMPDANTLQIDDNITYERFVPKKGHDGPKDLCAK